MYRLIWADVSVRQVIDTRTACYRAVLLKSTIGGLLREKKGRRRGGKEERRRIGEEERSTSCHPRSRVAREPSLPARGERSRRLSFGFNILFGYAGLKALWKHNIYGLTPSIGSAHYLLSYAKEHNDDKLMVKIMRVLEKNSVSLQPGTADIVFRYVSAHNFSCRFWIELADFKLYFTSFIYILA
ncbi:hypothetical protein BHE74_00020695 [Ensete ventricosum]|nr:hypothetical protein BHE74_00020695 [Ensete ventricosum]